MSAAEDAAEDEDRLLTAYERSFAGKRDALMRDLGAKLGALDSALDSSIPGIIGADGRLVSEMRLTMDGRTETVKVRRDGDAIVFEWPEPTEPRANASNVVATDISAGPVVSAAAIRVAAGMQVTGEWVPRNLHAPDDAPSAGWVPVTESLPGSGVRVIVAHADGVSEAYRPDCACEYKWIFTGHGPGNAAALVTHWMHFPAPPHRTAAQWLDLIRDEVSASLLPDLRTRTLELLAAAAKDIQ